MKHFRKPTLSVFLNLRKLKEARVTSKLLNIVYWYLRGLFYEKGLSEAKYCRAMVYGASRLSMAQNLKLRATTERKQKV